MYNIFLYILFNVFNRMVSSSALFSQVEIKARDQMYMAAAEQQIERDELKLCAMFARIGIPVMVVIFQIVYWTVGKV